MSDDAVKFGLMQDCADLKARAEKAEADLACAMLAMRKFAELEARLLVLGKAYNEGTLRGGDQVELSDGLTARTIVRNAFRRGDVEAALKAMEADDE